MTGWHIPVDASPWRLSGTVYGTLLNDRAALEALGDAVSQPPYKAAPRAPVLYVKPRNTLAGPGAEVAVAQEAGEFEVGASLGLVIGRTACRVSEADAPAHLAGYVLVADLSVPHREFYRPSVRFKARDGSCVIGPRVVAREALDGPDALEIRVCIDGRPMQVANTARMLRPVTRLIADVSEFMTLHPGDLLMLGVAHGAPRARAGQWVSVEAEGLGRLHATLVDAARGVPA